MMLMASGADLLNIYIGLEVMSISIYILTGFKRSKLISNEASLKYFLLGAFATGFCFTASLLSTAQQALLTSNKSPVS